MHTNNSLLAANKNSLGTEFSEVIKKNKNQKATTNRLKEILHVSIICVTQQIAFNKCLSSPLASHLFLQIYAGLIDTIWNVQSYFNSLHLVKHQ